MNSNRNVTKSNELKPRILVIDNDSEVAGAVFEALGYEGLQVEIAENQRQALALLTGDLPFHLVIANTKMQVINWLELLRRVIQLRKGFQFIVMKRRSLSNNHFRQFKEGASGHAFDVRALREVVRQVLNCNTHRATPNRMEKNLLDSSSCRTEGDENGNDQGYQLHRFPRTVWVLAQPRPG